MQDVETMLNQGQLPFVKAARAQTMMRDFNKLRDAIRSHDSFATEAAWDNCERWLGQLNVISNNDTLMSKAGNKYTFY